MSVPGETQREVPNLTQAIGLTVLRDAAFRGVL